MSFYSLVLGVRTGIYFFQGYYLIILFSRVLQFFLVFRFFSGQFSFFFYLVYLEQVIFYFIFVLQFFLFLVLERKLRRFFIRFGGFIFLGFGDLFYFFSFFGVFFFSFDSLRLFLEFFFVKFQILDRLAFFSLGIQGIFRLQYFWNWFFWSFLEVEVFISLVWFQVFLRRGLFVLVEVIGDRFVFFLVFRFVQDVVFEIGCLREKWGYGFGGYRSLFQVFGGFGFVFGRRFQERVRLDFMFIIGNFGDNFGVWLVVVKCQVLCFGCDKSFL